MKAYSLDLRQRVVEAYEQNQGSLAEVAEQFRVSTSFVKKMLRQWRQTADLAPRPHGGGKPASLSQSQRHLLRRKVKEHGDISLAELQQALVDEQSLSVHLSTISRALSRLGLPRKKRA